MSAVFDKVILGAGLYGLYSAVRCGRRGERVAVVERDPEPFSRATYANQARVHMGYHYPRSLATALKCAGYFRRFADDFGFCVRSDFEQVYATSSRLSWTSAREFGRFCAAAGIRCDEVPAGRYFKPGTCDGAFLTEERTYDARMLKGRFLDELGRLPNVELLCGREPASIAAIGGAWRVELSRGGGVARSAVPAERDLRRGEQRAPAGGRGALRREVRAL